MRILPHSSQLQCMRCLVVVSPKECLVIPGTNMLMKDYVRLKTEFPGNLINSHSSPFAIMDQEIRTHFF